MESTNAGATGALIAQRRRCLAALLALLLAAGLGLWRSGLLSLRDRCPSPAGDAVIRIYDRAPAFPQIKPCPSSSGRRATGAPVCG